MIQSLQGIGMTSSRTRERMINRLMEQGIRSNKILDVIRNTPRHIFMDEALASRAYEDTALPIGYNQTISQPYIVAKMTELLLVSSGRLEKVLEIGTGCGYQTAILAQLVNHVYSVERIAPLQKKAKDRLWDLKLKNVSYLHSDGGWGWQDHAPYDGILVAAAPPEIPEMLLQQMAVGGVMVIPIGKGSSQQLQRVTRTEGGYEVERLEPVVFVPFLSGRK
ncbi:protein-L-isoaspartate(D-aspartate) O-methyltransferase [Methylobacter sp.]|uniref:protein-L-isoaspartate(D-aspartate) O-methyltransferase n=1 Tax=Methylobacter sp. TaxID=2051955 RepID=UPI002487DB08|nr:protein-L-isoaspartate(D-aspartate) O-methyltransferase [Methylobacter sp.]MDI1276800.1 protein-L-isoaspartate(D-aspartate) O-methyltransferase [Methylobacter sp.]MDI1357468.1 protein-L-isoaspartate(D-aspartate) O-methyltransferase [Methylobacter sp.]